MTSNDLNWLTVLSNAYCRCMLCICFYNQHGNSPQLIVVRLGLMSAPHTQVWLRSACWGWKVMQPQTYSYLAGSYLPTLTTTVISSYIYSQYMSIPKKWCLLHWMFIFTKITRCSGLIDWLSHTVIWIIDKITIVPLL